MHAEAALRAASPAASASAEPVSGASGKVFHHMNPPPAAEGKGQLLPARPHNRPLLWSPCWAPSSAVQQEPDRC